MRKLNSTTSLALLSFLFLSLLLSCTSSVSSDLTNNPSTTDPYTTQPGISISNTLYAPHFIHFEMTVNKTITTDLEVGFLISTTATIPQNPTNKQGYISRTFSSNTEKRQVLLFMHDATAYTTTNIENTFESTDFLQENTSYYLHIFNPSLSTIPQAFKTMSYETLNAIGNSITALDGLANTNVANITRVIERKPNDPTILPAIIFGGGYPSTKIKQGIADIYQCGYSSQKCVGLSGFKDYQQYRNSVDYYTLLIPPNTRVGSDTWTLLTGAITIYKSQINSITE